MQRRWNSHNEKYEDSQKNPNFHVFFLAEKGVFDVVVLILLPDFPSFLMIAQKAYQDSSQQKQLENHSKK